MQKTIPKNVVLWHLQNYIITREGEVINYKTLKMLNPMINKKGYAYIDARRENKRKHIFVHRAVALLYCEGYAEGLEINHIDGNKLNNHASNLEFVTSSYNMRHAYNTGLHSTKLKSELIARAVKMVQTGISQVKAAQILGISDSALCRNMPAHLKPGSMLKINKEEWVTAKEMVAQGHTYKEVAEKYNVTPTAIWARLKREREKKKGVIMKKQEEIADKTKKLIVNTDYDPKDPKKRYKKAMMHRTLLLGVKYDGVDWEPYNVVLHTVPFKECNQGIEYLRQFWANFWPYLNNLIQDWEKVQGAYWEDVQEQDNLLKKSAEYIHDNKLMKLFMKEHKLDTLYKMWEEQVNASITKKSKR